MGQDLLVIDQEPLFEEAFSACKQARDSIERLKSELHCYETHDQPQYERWYHSTFGSFLTRIRELSAIIVQKSSALDSMKKRHWAKFFGGGPPSENAFGHEEERSFSGMHATWTVHEDFIVEEDPEDGEYGPEHEDYRYFGGEDGVFDDEQDYYFSEDDDAARRFEELFARGTSWRSNSSGYKSRGSFHSRGPGDFGKSDEGRVRVAQGGFSSLSAQEIFLAKLKECYRLLVKKLHPDLNPDLTQEERNLWNQVQLAYKKENLDQLELLVAISDAFSGKLSGATSLHQLRKARGEIELLIAPMRRKLESAAKERAWNFSTLQDRSGLKREIEAELVRELARLEQELKNVESQTRRFSRNSQSPGNSPEAEQRA